MEGYTERELMEGVFVYEKNKQEDEDGDDIKTVQEPLEDRMGEIQTLVNSVGHLLRSNKELAAALEEGFDQDFVDAIADNEVTISKQKAEILVLKHKIFEDFRVSVPLPPYIEDCSEGVFL